MNWQPENKLEELQRFGPYKIQQKLGQGGSGTVYLAVDTRLGRQIALKTFSRVQAASQQVFQQTLLREAMIVANLKHPNIVSVYDVVETPSGQVEAIVMEYLSGGDLHQKMRSSPIPPTQAIAITLQLCKALAAVHDIGIIHRDIKSQNVLFDEKGQVKLSDFGIADNKAINNSIQSDREKVNNSQQLALALNTSTHTSAVSGSVLAMSPEQACGEELDQRSDIFSLGLLLYQLLSGVHPFQSESTSATLNRLVNCAHRPIRQLQPTLPPEIDSVMAILLSKTPEHRYSFVEQLAEQLNNISAILDSSPTTKINTDTHTLEAAAPVQPFIQNSLIPQLTKKPWRRWLQQKYAFILAALIVSSGLFIALQTFISDRPDNYYLAVLPPRGLPLKEPSLTLLSPTVFHSMQSALQDVSSLPIKSLSNRVIHLIDRSEFSELPQNPKSILIGTGADEVLSSEIHCQHWECSLQFVRLKLSEDKKPIQIGRQQVTFRHDDLLEVAEFIRAVTGQLYQLNRQTEEQQHASWDSDQYSIFIELWNDFVLGQDAHGLFTRAESLSNEGFQALPIGLLKSDILLRLYDQTRNQQWLNQNYKLLLSLLSQYPDSLAIKSHLFDVAFYQQQFGQAQRWLRELEIHNPHASDVLLQKAKLLFAEQKQAQAISLLEQLQDQRPSWQYSYTLAAYQMRMGDTEAAAHSLKKLLALYPGHLYGRSLLADIHLMQGEAETALAQYKKLDYLDYASATNIGICYLLMKNYQQAIQSFRQVLAMENGDIYEADFYLADALYLAGKQQEAKKYYQQVVMALSSLEPDGQWQALSARAQAQARLGYFEAAIEDIQQVLLIAKDNPDAAFQAFIVFSLVGDTVSAKVYEQKARALGVPGIWMNHQWVPSYSAG